MDSEKIIFIILALVFSIFSMFTKKKKQKQTTYEKEQIDTDFPDNLDVSTLLNKDYLFKQFDGGYLQENSKKYPKKNKKKQKDENFEEEKFTKESSKTILQNIDLQKENTLLEHFEGTELQKAFLYSEIFKNANN